MNVGDLVMVTLREDKDDDKQRPGLILQFDENFKSILVLTGPKQLWVEPRQVRPFPAASMAQTRRATAALEKMVIKTKGGMTDDE